MSGSATRRVEHLLGTAVTVHVEDGDPDAVDAFFASIVAHERVLSRFRPDSDLSRVARGELSIDAVDPAVREVVGACEQLRFRTRGDFDHEPRRRSGDPGDPTLDVDAYAKGWIVEQACLRLRMAGVRSYFVNAGGDLVLGEPPPGTDGWSVGVADPFDRSLIRARLRLGNAAVATSGLYERGGHIRRAGGGALASVTVVGDDLATADALATAVFAAGTATPCWWDHDGRDAVLAITPHGALRWTSALDRYGFRFAPLAA